MKPIIPDAALEQHIAVLGKTGSGKTSTAKLIVEQVVPRGARVCVLDPIKSDWWGVTSSADGKKAGLPFHILGGPHGHVPLHSNAGKAIGELVGSGKLPLTIVDMADFEAGGVQRFFVDFAPALLKSMRGVLYLVWEEAHEYAPKERSGFEKENMAIHFAKKIATAGRSKGIRLIVATQATQLLHNRVLGSCETMIVHRFTAPADQEPVIKWLKANTTKTEVEQVEGSLSRMVAGEAWIVSGEAQVFERRKFPRIHTYDNSATPTDNDHQHEVKTAPVDLEELKSAIGDAVKEAEANDPKLLRAEISKLKADIAKAVRNHAADATASPLELAAARQEGREEAGREGYLLGLKQLAPIAERIGTLALSIAETVEGYQADLKRLAAAPLPKSMTPPVTTRAAAKIGSDSLLRMRAMPGGPGATLPKAERLILTALAQYPQGRTKVQVAVLTGYAVNGGGFANALGSLRSAERIDGSSDRLVITENGLNDLGPFDPLPRGTALLAHWYGQLGKAEKKALEALVAVYPRSLSKMQLGNAAGYEPDGGGFNNALGRLRSLELISGRGEMKASEDLFDG